MSPLVMSFVPPILFMKEFSLSRRHLSHLAICEAATLDLWGVTPPHHCCCGETEPLSVRPTHLALDRTLAQPVPVARYRW